MTQGRIFEIRFENDTIVVTHRAEGHVFRFPVVANAVSLHGAHITTNESAPHPGRYFLSQAMDAALNAYAERRSSSGKD